MLLSKTWNKDKEVGRPPDIQHLQVDLQESSKQGCSWGQGLAIGQTENEDSSAWGFNKTNNYENENEDETNEVWRLICDTAVSRN